jgi:hypothetical protein
MLGVCPPLGLGASACSSTLMLPTLPDEEDFFITMPGPVSGQVLRPGGRLLTASSSLSSLTGSAAVFLKLRCSMRCTAVTPALAQQRPLSNARFRGAICTRIMPASSAVTLAHLEKP